MATPFSLVLRLSPFLGLVLMAAAAEPTVPKEYAAPLGGSAERGQSLFALPKGLCAGCHSVDGSGSKVGPDLSTIGDTFRREDLVRAILEPASKVAVGYGTTLLETRDGGSLAGVIRDVSDEAIDLMTVDGERHRVPIDDIVHREEPVISLMPPGLHAGYTPEEFADLIAYLESLRTPAGEAGLGDGTVDETPVATRPVTLEPLFPEGVRFDEPTWFEWIPGRGMKACLVAEHGGGLWVVENGAKRLVLDLRGVVRRGGATGLLAVAFHPDFGNNRRYFLKYQIVENGVISTILEERRFAVDRDTDSGEPGRQLMKIRAVTQDHNGGSLGFGPDGFLYLGMGDTGPQGDPRGHGQDLSLLLGKMIRIDVDRRDEGLPYAVPPDNPFVGRENARPEIWAYGLREPWRLSWDPETEDLWVGDVGQARFEEVSIIRKGENLGWNVYEAHRNHSDRFRREDTTYVPPVLGYSHRLGLSVTGGHVYRGTKAPKLRGWYVFGDFESRRLWALTQQDRRVTRVIEIGRAPSRVVTFARDPEGELCLAGFDNGILYRLNLGDVDPRPRELRALAPTAERQAVTWHYRTTPPREGWMSPEFDETGWQAGPAGFGTENTPGAIVRTRWDRRDIWLRREFNAPAEAGGTGPLILRMHHDEDVEVFLNGIEIARRPRWTQGYVEEELPVHGALKPGRNVLAVHCRQNSGGQYIDVGLYEVIHAPSDR